MATFIHPRAICESHAVGDDTNVWAFAHILPRAVIGRECNICDHVFVENDVTIGDRVTVKCGVQLWDGIDVDADVFIGPNASFTNDRFPRSKQHQDQVLRTHIAVGASIGANATILPGLRIGEYAMIGAGAVVTRDVPSGAVVTGNPGRITGYVNTECRTTSVAQTESSAATSWHAYDTGATLYKMKSVEDMRGDLTVGTFVEDIPFSPARYFVVHNVKSRHVRGEHAHRECQQFLICTTGCLTVLADNGHHREEFTLDRPDLGLYVPPMVWCLQYKHSTDAVLLVFASDGYDSADYIRDYNEFLHVAQTRETSDVRRPFQRMSVT